MTLEGLRFMNFYFILTCVSRVLLLTKCVCQSDVLMLPGPAVDREIFTPGDFQSLIEDSGADYFTNFGCFGVCTNCSRTF